MDQCERYIDNWISLYEANDRLAKKNLCLSMDFRKEANDSFLYNEDKKSEKAYKRILSLYSKSIAFAPKNLDELLAMTYANRSALLLHLKKYTECLRDIDTALELTKSEFLRFKLLARKDQCSAFARSCGENDAPPLNDRRAATISASADRTYVSDCLSVMYSEKYGRYVQASRDIRPGEIVVVERGYVTFAKRDKAYLICSHCLESAWAAVACPDCSIVVYCSESCRREAYDRYHSEECPILPYVRCFDCDEIELETCMLALRSFIIAVKEEGWTRVAQQVQSIDEQRDKYEEGEFPSEPFLSRSFRSMYSLSYLDNIDDDYGDTHDRMLADLIERKTNLLHINEDEVDGFENKEERANFVRNLLKKLRKIININSFQFQDSSCKCEDFQECTSSCDTVRGAIVLPYSSLLNHSCYPNVERTFARPGKIVLFSTRPIERGEQLYDSYGPVVGIDRQERQDYLRDYFGFTCECRACRENWSTHTSCPVIQMRDSAVTKSFFTELLIKRLHDVFVLPLIKRPIDVATLEKTILLIEIIYKYFDGFVAHADSSSHRAYIERAFCKFYGV
ncbi:hypothetical protein TKK_0002457 [Trichogramma kaykai]|uniref:MYND-type domain-containing protein n=1 Tax=Trichogramma kaykai TaxID=54128 RepID=A0ABD2VX21_9HYME